MRRLLLALSAAAAFAAFQSPARAADFYLETLAVGADAGSTAISTSLSVNGNQVMLRCTSYAVTYKLCEAAGTCLASANDSPIDADQSVDVCGLSGYTRLSVFRAYDGGLPSCRLFRVNPPSPQCKQ